LCWVHSGNATNWTLKNNLPLKADIFVVITERMHKNRSTPKLGSFSTLFLLLTVFTNFAETETGCVSKFFFQLFRFRNFKGTGTMRAVERLLSHKNANHDDLIIHFLNLWRNLDKMDVLHIIVDYTLNLKSTSASFFVKTYSFNDGFGWRFSWKHIWIHLVNPVIGGPSGHVSVLSPSGMVCWQLVGCFVWEILLPSCVGIMGITKPLIRIQISRIRMNQPV